MCCKSNFLLCLTSNIALSVCIIIINKLVYVKTKFPNVTLSFLHFVVTSLGLKICEKLNIFQGKHIPLLQILPLALSFCGFVVFTNLSLGHNTVGTFQIMKTLTMPTVMLIQSFIYHRSFSRRIKISVVPISLGVILNSAYDIKFNILGTVFAIIGVTVTSFYQVWVGEKQKELQVNSMQLLYYQAPLSASMMLLIFPLLEPPWATDGLMYRTWTTLDMALIFLSCAVAFLVNLSIYWIIGNTSAVTYNVVGQLKFCLTLIGGYLIFQEAVMPIQGLGILITLVGISLYAHFKIKDRESQMIPYVVHK